MEILCHEKQEKIHGSSLYHVMVQGINREYIFNNDEYIEKYKYLIKEKLLDSHILIMAYCIMNNHAHFLIFSEKSQYLSKYMQKLNTAYSNYYNKNEKRIGYVFRDRYKTQDIYDKEQLIHCLAYIHNNPVKAGMVDKPYKYRHSSYNEFLGNRKIISEKSVEFIFGSIDKCREVFGQMHIGHEEIDFIDVKDKEIGEFIKEFENENRVDLKDIKNDKGLLKSFIKEARQKTSVTLIELSKFLDYSKSAVAKYAK